MLYCIVISNIRNAKCEKSTPAIITI